ncbi:ABC transporter substrate-binding protein [Coraliomargarita algicola]|uniref:ABC transporter substrate-binding protein n=1 Tax=Coraliomargarita algicola TaxID=3092156 RepID=A0ABZ0RN06_9BACT|nr:ABC transporter substrate-binding protein [Coraliomargarita sp. J2-16]WPJ96897.1 ABC transporter substrate-binding protein [Coraliomargarita sp. J2-16]
MTRKLHFICFVLGALSLLGGLSACRERSTEDEHVLRVGLIVSLTGPARYWGLVTMRSAQVAAQYYNERGGFDLDGEKVKIELVVVDDAFDSVQAARVAHSMVSDGIRYIIGPLGDSTLAAAGRVLDGSGAFYVHYGFHREVQSTSSLGVLGMPLPEQSLPVMLRHLRDQQGVERVLVMAYGTEEGVRQKGIAEQVAINEGLQLVQLARYDVSEETFDVSLDPGRIQRKVRRVADAAPEALIVVGCPPEAFIVLVDRLRSGGYAGIIGTQNTQDPEYLARLGEASEDVYYVGGAPPDALRSDYFESLRDRYLDLADEWDEEANTKLYALEFILACIRVAGLDALEETSVMYRVLPEFSFEDPFYREPQQVSLLGGQDEGVPLQLQIPIRISRMSGGQAIVVEEAKRVRP